jgi:hypothetical protein
LLLRARAILVKKKGAVSSPSKARPMYRQGSKWTVSSTDGINRLMGMTRDPSVLSGSRPGSAMLDPELMPVISTVLTGKETKWLILPDDDLQIRFDVVIAFALCYTALVTPYEVAVLTTSFNARFYINCVVDVLYFLGTKTLY